MKNILIVDDDEKICWAFEQFLTDEGYNPIIASNAEEGLRQIENNRPDLVMLDIRLPGISGLEALQEIKKIDPQIQVVIMTAYHNVETTITAMRLQAFDFLPKPIDLDQVKAILNRVSRLKIVRKELAIDIEKRTDQTPKLQLVGKSLQMQEIYKMIGIMASNNEIVLIEGENGTGKELVARAIHHNSLRQDGRFVAINCGAIPDPLLESELFGYVPGAFTGASAQGKPGKFELADGGTIFLDEISNMSSALQVKLQRTLQEGEIERLGGTKTIKINTRIIAATNQNLSQTVKQGDFREDLYYRVNRVLIKLPPLRDRINDIPLLVEHFIKQINSETNQNIRGVSSETTQLLQNYEWPGNVRELENAVKSAVVLSRSDVILPEHLPKEIQNPTSATALQMELKSALLTIVKEAIKLKKDSLYNELTNTLEAELIPTVINACNHNQTQAAKLLGISRTTLIQKLKKRSKL